MQRNREVAKVQKERWDECKTVSGVRCDIASDVHSVARYEQEEPKRHAKTRLRVSSVMATKQRLEIHEKAREIQRIAVVKQREKEQIEAVQKEANLHLSRKSRVESTVVHSGARLCDLDMSKRFHIQIVQNPSKTDIPSASELAKKVAVQTAQHQMGLEEKAAAAKANADRRGVVALGKDRDLEDAKRLL
jgi:hypothetical protein